MSQFKTLLCLLGCEFCVSMMITSYLYIVKVINFLNELEENEKSFSLKDEGLKYFISQRYIQRAEKQTQREVIKKRQVMKQSKCTQSYKLWDKIEDKNESRERVRITEVMLANKYRV